MTKFNRACIVKKIYIAPYIWRANMAKKKIKIIGHHTIPTSRMVNVPGRLKKAVVIKMDKKTERLLHIVFNNLCPWEIEARLGKLARKPHHYKKLNRRQWRAFENLFGFPITEMSIKGNLEKALDQVRQYFPPPEISAKVRKAIEQNS